MLHIIVSVINLVLSGSYDHTAKCIDAITDELVSAEWPLASLLTLHTLHVARFALMLVIVRMYFAAVFTIGCIRVTPGYTSLNIATIEFWRATGSYDGTVKKWDVFGGQCAYFSVDICCFIFLVIFDNPSKPSCSQVCQRLTSAILKMPIAVCVWFLSAPFPFVRCLRKWTTVFELYNSSHTLCHLIFYLQIRLLRACQDTLCVCHSEDYNIHTFTFQEVQEDFPPTSEQDPIGSPGYYLFTSLLIIIVVNCDFDCDFDCDWDCDCDSNHDSKWLFHFNAVDFAGHLLEGHSSSITGLQYAPDEEDSITNAVRHQLLITLPALLSLWCRLNQLALSASIFQLFVTSWACLILFFYRPQRSHVESPQWRMFANISV